MRTWADVESSKNKFRAAQGKMGSSGTTQKCPVCNVPMMYVYGEKFECPVCGRKELSDFGKVREFVEEYGPQPAMVISQATNVNIEVIESLLSSGRVEIPDGSGSYIRCQSCGTAIRYGRYCPECAANMIGKVREGMLSKDAGEKPTVNIDVGERPKVNPEMEGRMHIKHKTLSER